jgi:hypothetical protein
MARGCQTGIEPPGAHGELGGKRGGCSSRAEEFSFAACTGIAAEQLREGRYRLGLDDNLADGIGPKQRSSSDASSSGLMRKTSSSAITRQLVQLEARASSGQALTPSQQ